MKLSFFKKVFQKNLPDTPGVYFFLKGKEKLYIGKATSLRSRVKSYFAKDLAETRGPLLVGMLSLANKVDWKKTDSVLEALILEANLIKKHQPKYNIREKDDKSFNYVLITKEKLPKIIIVRGKDLKDLTLRGSIFGPFTNGGQLKEAMKLIRRIFPYLDEKSKNYHEFYRQLNLVPNLADRKIYLQNIKNIKLFFQGKKKKIIRNLKKEMMLFAKAEEFEKASELRRQLFALEHINDVALVKSDASSPVGAPLFRIEGYDVAHMSGQNMVGVMTVVEDGIPTKNEYRKFKIRTQKDSNDTGALVEVIERRLAHTEWPYPNLIVLDGGHAQINAVTGVFKSRGVGIPVVSVLKDERHRPKNILGSASFARKYEKEILLVNNEAHRFAISYHKNMRGKNFLR